MPKLLIICDVYPPSFAPRMGYLVKYMEEYGWAADIVTRNYDGDFSFKSLLGNEKVFRVGEKPLPLRTLKEKLTRLLTKNQQHTRRKDYMVSFILDHLKPDDYSFILASTAFRTFILDVADEVSKSWNKPWIADLRDIFEQKPIKISPNKDLKNYLLDKLDNNYQKFMFQQRNLRFKNVNTITTITPWHVEQLKKYNPNTHLIYNGYDPENFYPQVVKGQKQFKITYTGIINSIEYRDPTLLFRAVKKLSKNNIIDKEQFRIQLYTQKNRRAVVIENKDYQEIKEFVDFYDYVDTSEIPKILNESSILLLLSNKYTPTGPKGLISTTKYFEYLAVERPILCIKSDEDLLEESIHKANAGLSARTLDETYDFLLEKWNEWKNKGRTSVKINKEYIKQFSRKKQAKQFVDLFEKVIRE